MTATKWIFFATLLASTLLTRPCMAMLAISSDDKSDAQALDQAIARRNAADLSSADFKRLREHGLEAQNQLFSVAKAAVAPAIPSDVAAATTAGETSAHITFLAFIAAIPTTLLLFMFWLTKRSLAIREREQLEMLSLRRSTKPAAPAEKIEAVKTPPPKSDLKKFEEIWARTQTQESNDQNADIQDERQSSINSFGPLMPIPTPT